MFDFILKSLELAFRFYIGLIAGAIIIAFFPIFFVAVLIGILFLA